MTPSEARNSGLHPPLSPSCHCAFSPELPPEELPSMTMAPKSLQAGQSLPPNPHHTHPHLHPATSLDAGLHDRAHFLGTPQPRAATFAASPSPYHEALCQRLNVNRGENTRVVGRSHQLQKPSAATTTGEGMKNLQCQQNHPQEKNHRGDNIVVLSWIGSTSPSSPETIYVVSPPFRSFLMEAEKAFCRGETFTLDSVRSVRHLKLHVWFLPPDLEARNFTPFTYFSDRCLLLFWTVYMKLRDPSVYFQQPMFVAITICVLPYDLSIAEVGVIRHVLEVDALVGMVQAVMPQNYCQSKPFFHAIFSSSPFPCRADCLPFALGCERILSLPFFNHVRLPYSRQCELPHAVFAAAPAMAMTTTAGGDAANTTPSGGVGREPALMDARSETKLKILPEARSPPPFPRLRLVVFAPKSSLYWYAFKSFLPQLLPAVRHFDEDGLDLTLYDHLVDKFVAVSFSDCLDTLPRKQTHPPLPVPIQRLVTPTTTTVLFFSSSSSSATSFSPSVSIPNPLSPPQAPSSPPVFHAGSPRPVLGRRGVERKGKRRDLGGDPLQLQQPSAPAVGNTTILPAALQLSRRVTRSKDRLSEIFTYRENFRNREQVEWSSFALSWSCDNGVGLICHPLSIACFPPSTIIYSLAPTHYPLPAISPSSHPTYPPLYTTHHSSPTTQYPPLGSILMAPTTHHSPSFLLHAVLNTGSSDPRQRMCLRNHEQVLLSGCDTSYPEKTSANFVDLTLEVLGSRPSPRPLRPLKQHCSLLPLRPLFLFSLFWESKCFSLGGIQSGTWWGWNQREAGFGYNGECVGKNFEGVFWLRKRVPKEMRLDDRMRFFSWTNKPFATLYWLDNLPNRSHCRKAALSKRFGRKYGRAYLRARKAANRAMHALNGNPVFDLEAWTKEVIHAFEIVLRQHLHPFWKSVGCFDLLVFKKLFSSFLVLRIPQRMPCQVLITFSPLLMKPYLLLLLRAAVLAHCNRPLTVKRNPGCVFGKGPESFATSTEVPLLLQIAVRVCEAFKAGAFCDFTFLRGFSFEDKMVCFIRSHKALRGSDDNTEIATMVTWHGCFAFEEGGLQLLESLMTIFVAVAMSKFGLGNRANEFGFRGFALSCHG